MKLLQFCGYIKLPEDFEGDDVDAMEWYVNYRREKNRPKTYHETGEDEKDITEMTLKEFMSRMYKTLIESGVARGGVMKLLESKDGKWERIAGDED